MEKLVDRSQQNPVKSNLMELDIDEVDDDLVSTFTTAFLIQIKQGKPCEFF